MKTLRRLCFVLSVAVVLVLGSAGEAAVFPGGNGAIVFVRNFPYPVGSELFRIEPNGSDEKRLTTNTLDDDGPVWSPDGTKIAFARLLVFPSSSARVIFVMNADGSGAKLVTSGQEMATPQVTSLTWSPDGTRIAYTVEDGPSELWLTNPEGTVHRRLAGPYTNVFNPTWSPDGRLIAFTRQVGSDAEVWAVRPNGTGLHGITNHASGGGSEPAWSPDGARLAYLHAESFADGTDVWVINRDGTNDQNLTKTAGVTEYPPAWSPDGSRLLFSRDVGGTTGDDIISLAVATADETNLTNSPSTVEGAPSWSPDATKILFTRLGSGLFVMDDDGSNEVPLADGLTPNWQPLCTINGTAASETLTGTSGRDVICGLGGADVIRGGDGNDIIFGGDGNDRIIGGNGDDIVVGQAGNDMLLPGPGKDLAVGAAGLDTVSYATSLFAISLSLIAGTATGDGADTIVSVENVIGSSKADALTGKSGANVLTGRGGNDRLAGSSGNDLLLGGAGNDTLNGGRGTDTCKQGSGSGPLISCERH
jgi:Tol biopolymer transport system component